MAENEDRYREQVKERYGFAQWAGRAADEEGVLRREVELPESLIEGWTRESSEPLTEFLRGDRAMRWVFAAGKAADADRVQVTLSEHGSAGDAHEALIDLVMTFMATSLPTCESVGIKAGDVCFGAHGDVQTGAVFARYNVLVQVESIGARPTSVAPFAERIDGILREGG